jgi:hypothetical protein
MRRPTRDRSRDRWQHNRHHMMLRVKLSFLARAMSRTGTRRLGRSNPRRNPISTVREQAIQEIAPFYSTRLSFHSFFVPCSLAFVSTTRARQDANESPVFPLFYRSL